jgi:hypothetical protein
MHVRPVVFVPVLACALCLGALGCGNDDSDGEDTVTETVTTEAAETEAEESAGGGEAATGGEAAEPLAARPVRRGPRYFETPSSNIGCYVSARSTRCDIRERNWDPPPSDTECELDYGQGIGLSPNGKADFVCAGDTALGGPATLGYGEVSRRGFLRCRSGSKGITCTEVRSGHGFFLSRESYRIF